jgi:hypothetical protein
MRQQNVKPSQSASSPLLDQALQPAGEQLLFEMQAGEQLL